MTPRIADSVSQAFLVVLRPENGPDKPFRVVTAIVPIPSWGADSAPREARVAHGRAA